MSENTQNEESKVEESAMEESNEEPKTEKVKKEKVKKEKPPKEKKDKKAPKMKKCSACHEEIPKKAKICPHCAAKQKGAPVPVILVAVLLLLMMTSVSILFFNFPVAPPFEVPFGRKPISDTTLGTGMQLTKEQEEAMLPVLEECGFTRISDVQMLTHDDEITTYIIHDTETIRYLEGDIVAEVDSASKVLRAITYKENDIYLSGHLITPVTEFYLDGAQRDVYLSACLDAVRARLEVPEAAVFPSKSGWQYSMDGDKVTVNSTVTVKTASGQESTRPFRVEFEGGSLVSFAFVVTGGGN